MIRSLSNIFRIPDLKRKILYTLGMIAVYRIGSHIPTPFIDPQSLHDFMQKSAGQAGLFSLIDMFSGGAFKRMTIFSLGIMPYISASIIIQLLTVVWPYLERLSKEGEAGKKKINQYTRYGTVLLSAFQAFGLGLLMIKQNLSSIPEHRFLFLITAIISITAGTCFIMWLGERITEKGIGNGISIIIAVGIIARYPFNIGLAYQQAHQGMLNFGWVPAIIIIMIAVSILIILIQQGQRKIPIQHAKRVVGRRVMGGSTTYLPLRINTAGVIPVIFSSSILMFPSTILSWFGGGEPGFLSSLASWFRFDSQRNLYNLLNMESGGVLNLLKCVNVDSILYSLLTGFFCFFYTAIVFNPTDTAENLRKYGAFIPESDRENQRQNISTLY